MLFRSQISRPTKPPTARLNSVFVEGINGLLVIGMDGLDNGSSFDLHFADARIMARSVTQSQYPTDNHPSVKYSKADVIEAGPSYLAIGASITQKSSP